MILTAVAFIIYGFSCLWSQHMKEEFIRFGLKKWRVLTAILQIIGALGLALGIFFHIIGAFAAAGLALLMLLGFITRLKVNDSIQESLPALLLMVLNIYLSYGNFNLI
ncbi:MAG: DoxX family protein [Leeuwenhoekiella sp.]